MNINTIESDHHPDKFDDGKASKRLELLGIKEELANPHERRQLFASLEDADFQKHLGYINAISQNSPIQYEYQAGALGSLLETPSAEDKTELMQQTYEAVRTILHNEDYSDKEALDRAGLTMAGAINYIHPYDNGNGRTGRLMHYLITYGTERGSEIDNEVYAIVAKQKVYDTDHEIALYDTPHPELTRSLDADVKKENKNLHGSELASQRVVRFLDMMTDIRPLSINTPVKRNTAIPGSPGRHIIEIPSGTIDGYTLYQLNSTDHSAIAQRSPEEVPREAQRIIAKHQEGETTLLFVDEI